MKLSDDIKAKIQAEYDTWQAGQYAGKSKEERQALGQFFTPPPLSIKMLEKFDSVVRKSMLDPTLGAGGLIAAAVIAGADPRKCYGIELDPDILKIAKQRLVKLGVPPHHLVQGDALDPASYDSIEDDSDECKSFAAVEKLEDGSIKVYVALAGKPVKEKVFTDRASVNKALAVLKKRHVKTVKM